MADAPLSLHQLSASDVERADVRFTDGRYVYTTLGERLGHGGMGNVFTVLRQAAVGGMGSPETVVAKTYREEYLLLLREDETARRRFDHFELVLDDLREIHHPNLLPMLLVSPIEDNYLLISPLAGPSLLTLIAQQTLSPRDRVGFLIQALRGLGALHDRGIVHRDFTLHNVLTMGDRAVLFDFDLSVAPSLLTEEERTYRGYYQGRVAGSPEFSVAPEFLDDVLGQRPISPRADVYSVGSALFALFTDDSLYGEVPDLSTLLYRISEGVVHRSQSRIAYPDAVPKELRPIIETCLQREPEARYANAHEIRRALEQLELGLSRAELPGRYRRTAGFLFTEVGFDLEQVWATRADQAITRLELTQIEGVLGRYGYHLEKSLGRVKGHPIFLALPDPELVATGRFGDENTYRKIVTAIDLAARPDGAQFVETWLRRIQPVLMHVRRGFLTALHKVVHDRPSGRLLLFTEYVDDPRFGSDLDKHELSLEEVFGLGLIVAQSIERLHRHGLAHNNVRPQSLVFKGRRDAGRVQALFLGLVEPSFEPAALAEDVRNLAQLVDGLVRQGRVDALKVEVQAKVEGVRGSLRRLGRGRSAATIQELLTLLEDGLAAIEPNFDIVRRHDGDVEAFADLLVRHSLYNKLYSLDVSDS